MAHYRRGDSTFEKPECKSQFGWRAMNGKLENYYFLPGRGILTEPFLRDLLLFIILTNIQVGLLH